MFAESLGWNWITVSSDSLDVITAMQDEIHSAGVAAAIRSDCSFLSRDFAKVEYVHEYREANTVAHELAFLAKMMILVHG